MLCPKCGARAAKAGIELAKEVVRLCEEPNDFTFAYELDLPIKDKIEAIVKKIYHGDGVTFTANAEKQIKTLTELGYDKMPICMAKDPVLLLRRPDQAGVRPGASPLPSGT